MSMFCPGCGHWLDRHTGRGCGFPGCPCVDNPKAGAVEQGSLFTNERPLDVARVRKAHRPPAEPPAHRIDTSQEAAQVVKARAAGREAQVLKMAVTAAHRGLTLREAACAVSRVEDRTVPMSSLSGRFLSLSHGCGQESGKGLLWRSRESRAGCRIWYSYETGPPTEGRIDL